MFRGEDHQLEGLLLLPHLKCKSPLLVGLTGVPEAGTSAKSQPQLVGTTEEGRL